jgi:hypothetical protein
LGSGHQLPLLLLLLLLLLGLGLGLRNMGEACHMQKRFISLTVAGEHFVGCCCLQPGPVNAAALDAGGYQVRT